MLCKLLRDSMEFSWSLNYIITRLLHCLLLTKHCTRHLEKYTDFSINKYSLSSNYTDNLCLLNTYKCQVLCEAFKWIISFNLHNNFKKCCFIPILWRRNEPQRSWEIFHHLMVSKQQSRDASVPQSWHTNSTACLLPFPKVLQSNKRIRLKIKEKVE